MPSCARRTHTEVHLAGLASLNRSPLACAGAAASPNRALHSPAAPVRAGAVAVTGGGWARVCWSRARPWTRRERQLLVSLRTAGPGDVEHKHRQRVLSPRRRPLGLGSVARPREWWLVNPTWQGWIRPDHSSCLGRKAGPDIFGLPPPYLQRRSRSLPSSPGPRATEGERRVVPMAGAGCHSLLSPASPISPALFSRHRAAAVGGGAGRASKGALSLYCNVLPLLKNGLQICRIRHWVCSLREKQWKSYCNIFRGYLVKFV
jgi:hypothetical protein